MENIHDMREAYVDTSKKLTNVRLEIAMNTRYSRKAAEIQNSKLRVTEQELDAKLNRIENTIRCCEQARVCCVIEVDFLKELKETKKWNRAVKIWVFGDYSAAVIRRALASGMDVLNDEQEED